MLTNEEINRNKTQGPYPAPYSLLAVIHTEVTVECGQQQQGQEDKGSSPHPSEGGAPGDAGEAGRVGGAPGERLHLG